MLLALAKDNLQRLIDDLVIHKDSGQVGNLTFHQCFLQFDAGCGNRNRELSLIGVAGVIPGHQRCHQIRKGLTGSYFRLAQGNLLLSKTSKHFLRQRDLLFSDGVPILGKNYAENGFDNGLGIISKAIQIPSIAGILHSVQNMRNQTPIGILLIKISGQLRDYKRGIPSGHVQCDIVDLVTLRFVIDDVAVFVGKIIYTLWMGFAKGLVCFKHFFVVVSNFKHFFHLFLSIEFV